MNSLLPRFVVEAHLGKLFEDKETERSNATAFTLVSLASGLRITFSAGCTSYVIQNDPSPSP